MKSKNQVEDRIALMRIGMFEEARELLGPGYVPSYYEQAASGFIQIAEIEIREAVRKVRKGKQ